jgi:ABC-type multidrug transport system ATPase subunit
MKLRARLVAQTGEASASFDVTADVIRIGRSPECEVAVDPAKYPMVSGLHARLEPAANGVVLVPLSRNKTLLNDAAMTGPAAVFGGERVRLGATGPWLELLAVESKPAAAAAPAAAAPTVPVAPPDYGQTVQAGEAHLKLLRGTAGADRFPIGNGGVIGREKGKVQYLLDHPHVSRLHASVAVTNGRVVLADLGSANGTFVNGERVSRPTALEPDDRVDVGPFALTFDGKEFVGASRANNVELIAHGVSRVVTDRGSGKPLTLLDDVTLVVRPREFVCLLGPSGSGKSTLLAMLSGRAAPSGGTVTVNGRDLYAHFAAHKQDIAVVPQKDLLHDTLPVGQALRYTAELRLPPDTDKDDLNEAVGDILGVVGLTARKGTLIRHLSGGQVKRASLANELLSKPSLLFLDEVTSGLDEQTDREVMELFRLVADGGKTVVCITHNLANVEATCSLVVILTAGGKLAFVGTPDEAKGYFDVPRLGDVYRKLADQTPEVWQDRFRQTEFYARYVTARLPDDSLDERAGGKPAAVPVPSRAVHQAWVLVRRYAAVWRGDLAAIAALLGQSLLVAALLAVVFGVLSDVESPIDRAVRTRNLLFLLGVSCFWFGCNTAAKELVKERTIFTRERAVNLRTDSYFASKLLVLLLIGTVQATLLFAVVRGVCGPPGNPFAQWLTLVLLNAAGTALGLVLSAVSDTEEVATALVPVAVIPQIVLAGVIAPLSGFKEGLAKAGITAFWGQRTLERLLPEDDRAILAVGSESAWSQAWVVAAHATAFAAVALAVLLARGRQRSAG